MYTFANMQGTVYMEIKQNTQRKVAWKVTGRQNEKKREDSAIGRNEIIRGAFLYMYDNKTSSETTVPEDVLLPYNQSDLRPSDHMKQWTDDGLRFGDYLCLASNLLILSVVERTFSTDTS